ncbi:MAG: hypothetical protein ACRDVC_04395 [Acidimicrobiales bacterium]
MMYKELLTRALDDWVDDTGHDDLLEHALTCRAKMLNHTARQGTNAYDALATELSYDRALIKLARAHALYANAADFSDPQRERLRLERSLASLGLDIVALAHQRRV